MPYKPLRPIQNINQQNIQNNPTPINNTENNSVVKNDNTQKTEYKQIDMSSVKQGVLANLPSAVGGVVGNFLKEVFRPVVEIGGGAVLNVANVVSQLKESSKSYIKGEKTTKNVLDRTVEVPIYKEIKPIFSGKEGFLKFNKKVIGSALELAPYIFTPKQSLSFVETISTIGKKPIQSLTKAELTSFTKSYIKKVGASSLGFGSMFGVGSSLREDLGLKDTIKNTTQAIVTIALFETLLTPLMFNRFASKTNKKKTPIEVADNVINENSSLIEKIKNEVKSLPEPKEIKLLSEPNKNIGDNFIMSDMIDSKKTILSKTLQEYYTKLKQYNLNPTENKKNNLLKLKNKIDVLKESIDVNKTNEANVNKINVNETVVNKTDVNKFFNQKLKTTEPSTAETFIPRVNQRLQIDTAIDDIMSKNKIDVSDIKLPEVEKINLKENLSNALKSINDDIDKARAILRGEKKVPANTNSTAFIAAFEHYLEKYPNTTILKELMESPLSKASSLGGQEVVSAKLIGGDSFLSKLKEIENIRNKKFEYKIKKAEKTKEIFKQETKKINLNKEDLIWDKFLESIKC